MEWRLRVEDFENASVKLVGSATDWADGAMVFGKKAVWTPSLDTPITKDTTFTATWVDTDEAREEIYYVLDEDDALPTHMYAFDDLNNKPMGAWPGAPIAAEDVTDVLRSNVGNTVTPHEGKIVRIQYPATMEATKFILNGDGDWQTGNLALTAGNTYFGDADAEGVATKTEAIKLMLDVEEARNAVVASGDIKAYSICGLGEGEAAKLYARYAALSEDGKALVARSVTYTYSGEGNDNVNYADIMEQVGLIASKNVSPLHYLENGASDSAMIWTLALAVILTVLMISAFVGLKKKKGVNE